MLLITKMEHFLKRIASKHNLNYEEIISEWKQFDELNTSYNKMKKPELVQLCIDKGYKSSGSKPDLVIYLMDEVKQSEKQPKKTASKPVETEQADVLKKIVAVSPVIVIRRNKHGNHEHPDSCFIFNPTTKKVIGKQEDDGTVSVITKSDIDTCNKYNFDYEIPESLDDNKTSSLLKEDSTADNMVDDIDLKEDDLVEPDMNEESDDDDIEYVDDV